MSRTAIAAALAAACALAPLVAYAQPKPESLSYRCVGKDGKKYYGQTLPPQCAGVPVELLNAQGVVVKRIDAKADAERKAQKDAEEAKRRQEEAALKEETRRTRALLATYTSEADIEAARQRALADNQKAVQEIETRIAAIKKRQAGYAKDMEFYKGKNKPPARLEQDARNVEIDLKAQEGLLEAKQKEVGTINAKYDEDKRRYLELTRGSAKK